jgi:EAL domain-containing protein (putative c-di-GMP-specific phosphodiesterase class I)
MICLEITESALMKDPIDASETLRKLRKLGVTVSIDDYGTGYSSLAYVKGLPVTELKIDRAFIKDMIKHNKDGAIVRSTITLAHNLGLNVVAEGVENEEELKLLQQLGCDQVQGYLFSIPLPSDQLEQWMRASTWGNPPVPDAMAEIPKTQNLTLT